MIAYSGLFMNYYFVCINLSKIFLKIAPKADYSLPDTIASM